MPASEEFDQYVKKFVSVCETILGETPLDLTVFNDFGHLKDHFDSNDNRPAFSLAGPIWDALQRYFTANAENFKVELKKALAKHADELRQLMDRTADAWMLTAGGAPHGKSWYDSCKPKGERTLTQHFEDNLEKVPGLAAMEAGMLNLKQVGKITLGKAVS